MLFFVPIAAFFFDFHIVLGVTASFHVISNVAKIGFFRKGADWTLILRMGIPAVLFVLAGAYFSKFLSLEIFEIVMAVCLIGISALLFIYRKAVIRPTVSNTVTGGIFSGLIAGLIGTGGAIRGLVLSAFSLQKEAFIATSSAIDLAVDSGRTVVYYANGYIGKQAFSLLPALLVVSVLGTYIGKRILLRISEERFKGLVLILVFLTGLFNLFKVLQH